jgi:nucleoside 2-deoxyribosyltransferase
MPFDKEFQDVYEAIKLALNNIKIAQKINCIRLDDIKKPGSITDALISEIQKSHICIADITGNNPNVLWEVGYVMALKKPLIQLTQKIEEIPFDLYDLRTIKYEQGNIITTLQKEIKEYFMQILKEYEFDEANILPENENQNDLFSIAVTGSQDMMNKQLCVRRLKSVLSPFIEKNVSWLVGSYGIADECTIDYLCEKKERVYVIGYHEYDISPNIINLIRKNKLLFIDAKKEQVPQIADAPTIRDTYMSIKSNLTIFLWDGSSLKTKKLIEWYLKIKKDFIVGFC